MPNSGWVYAQYKPSLLQCETWRLGATSTTLPISSRRAAAAVIAALCPDINTLRQCVWAQSQRHRQSRCSMCQSEHSLCPQFTLRHASLDPFLRRVVVGRALALCAACGVVPAGAAQEASQCSYTRHARAACKCVHVDTQAFVSSPQWHCLLPMADLHVLRLTCAHFAGVCIASTVR
jgi:hypothetical protein